MAELLVGVILADPRHRSKREAFVNEVLLTVAVEPYDTEVARAHASLIAHTRTSGRPRGAHDLMIAATAVTRNREVVTLDATGFDDLPNVRFRS